MVKRTLKEDVQMLGQDIRFIRLGKAHLQPMHEPFFLSGLYIGLLAAILVLSPELTSRCASRSATTRMRL